MTATWNIIAAIGRENLTRLQQEIGPRDLYVPISPDPEHRVAKVLGMAAMRVLCEEFGGTKIWIGNGYATAARNEEIFRAAKNGDSVETIALRWEITQRYVRVIVSDNMRAELDFQDDRKIQGKKPNE